MSYCGPLNDAFEHHIFRRASRVRLTEDVHHPYVSLPQRGCGSHTGSMSRVLVGFVSSVRGWTCAVVVFIFHFFVCQGSWGRPRYPPAVVQDESGSQQVKIRCRRGRGRASVPVPGRPRDAARRPPSGRGPPGRLPFRPFPKQANSAPRGAARPAAHRAVSDTNAGAMSGARAPPLPPD